MLAKSDTDITVGDIIRVLEGPIAPVDCLLSDQENNEYCDKADSCVTRNIWLRVATSIAGVLDGITLADLAKEDFKI